MGPRLMSRGKVRLSKPSSASGRSFNGAAAHEPRKDSRAVRVDGRILTASMGPRLMSRGKVGVIGEMSRCLDGFNGAAAHEPRKASLP